MRATKRSMPVIAACLLAGTCTVALAAPNQSLLDPNNYVAPATPKAKATKQPPAATPAAIPEEQSTTTFVTIPGSEFADGKPAKASKTAKAKAAPDSDGGGLLSGVNDKFKSASSGLVSGTKAAGGHMVSSTKKVREGIATGAKASGNYFMKGAKVIGHGIKATGDKVKDGTGTVGSKVASLPHAFKHSKTTVATKPAAAPVTKPLEIRPLPLVEKGETKQDLKPESVSTVKPPEAKSQTKFTNKEPVGKSGLVGKTLGTLGKLNPLKLNPFGKGSKNADSHGPETASKAPSTFPQ